MDNFKEQLVRAEDFTLYKVSHVVTIILAILGIVSMGFVGIIVAVILFVGAILLFYFKRFLYCEYEYSVTNGEFDIDVIYEQKSRKRKITFNMKEVALLAEVNSQAYKDFSNKPSKILNCIPKGNENKKYVALVTEGKIKVQVIFVPNKELIDACFIYNPKVVKR